MVTLSQLTATILQSPYVEDQVAALEIAQRQVDDEYALALLPGLQSITERLEMISQATELLSICQSLAGQIKALASQGMTEAALPDIEADPAACAQRDYALLIEASDPLLTALAGNLLLFTPESRGYGIDTAYNALLRTAELPVDLRAIDELRSGLNALETQIASSPGRSLTFPRYYTVLPEQNLRDIAGAIYGDPDNWPQLVKDYKLYPPYFSQTPRDGALSPGTRLPLAPDSTLLEVEGLGITFALEVTGKPRWGQDWDLIDQEGVGLATDRGLSAFATDLALRLATPLGSLDGEDNYGVTSVAGLDASAAGIYAQVAAVEALMEDRRVGKVLTSAEGTSTVTGVFVGSVIAVPRPDLLQH